MVEKQWETVEGLPVVAHTLRLCEKAGLVSWVLLGVPNNRIGMAKELMRQYAPSKELQVFTGGEERKDTVWKGLNLVSKSTDIVVIHDAARPFASRELFRRVIEKAKETGAAIPALPVRDTIKEDRKLQSFLVLLSKFQRFR